MFDFYVKALFTTAISNNSSNSWILYFCYVDFKFSSTNMGFCTVRICLCTLNTPKQVKKYNNYCYVFNRSRKRRHRSTSSSSSSSSGSSRSSSSSSSSSSDSSSGSSRSGSNSRSPSRSRKSSKKHRKRYLKLNYSL